MKPFQFGLLESTEENLSNLKNHDLSLPVSPLQYKQVDAEPILTECEFQIMDMTLKGVEISDISLKILRSIAGVKYRLSNVYQKFGVKNRLQLINKASKNGIQFRLSSGVKQTFHISLDTRNHEGK